MDDIDKPHQILSAAPYVLNPRLTSPDIARTPAVTGRAINVVDSHLSLGGTGMRRLADPHWDPDAQGLPHREECRRRHSVLEEGVWGQGVIED